MSLDCVSVLCLSGIVHKCIIRSSKCLLVLCHIEKAVSQLKLSAVLSPDLVLWQETLQQRGGRKH